LIVVHRGVYSRKLGWVASRGFMQVWEVYGVCYGYYRVVYTSFKGDLMGKLTSIKQGEVMVALSRV